MRAAFITNERMNFIDDQGPGRAEHISAAVAGQQKIERFGSGHDNVRRPARHLRAVGWRSVTGSDERANFELRQSHLPQLCLNTFERLLQIALDVIAERFERRDVDDLSSIFKSTLDSLTYEIIDGREKCRKSFT